MAVAELNEAARIFLRLAAEKDERQECAADPVNLIRRIRCWDERAGVEFGFEMDDPEAPWGWQRGVVDWSRANERTIVLKARQIGVTWVGCALSLWTALYQPGSLSLMYRQKAADAEKLVQRCWYMLNSLPAYLWNGAEVIKPTKGAQPTEAIVLKFPDGKISRIQAQSSADASGHGETAAYVLLDEFSRIDNAAEIMKAVSSAVGQNGRLFIISTANGVSNDQGGGNYFHYLWAHAEEQGLAKRFLSWRLHPDRDDHWLKTSPEILNLRPWERAEQYPDNEHEAFALTSAHFFDAEAMHDYGEKAIEAPAYRCEFVRTKPGRAKRVKKDTGWISIFAEPQEDRKYAMGVDTATGKGLDYSAAYVVDLHDLSLCAEFHGKLDTDLYAEQLHFLGRWYNTATLAVEDAGGFGNAVIIDLRDGRDGRPPYPRLYRHRQFTRADLPQHKPFGFPMSAKTRPQVLSHMEELVREKALPFLTSGLLAEMQTFCRYDPSGKKSGGTWPRAFPDGLHDDRVMACAIALEMYRQFGEHPEQRPRPKKREYRAPYPWQQTAAA